MIQDQNIMEKILQRKILNIIDIVIYVNKIIDYNFIKTSEYDLINYYCYIFKLVHTIVINRIL